MEHTMSINTDDKHTYTLEFRIENLSRVNCDKLLMLLKEFNNVKYKEFSKKEKTIAEQTSI